jgi:MFS family permease
VLVDLLRSPSMWGIMIAQAGGIYTLYLLLFWLPSYLQTTKGLSLMSTGVYTAVPWAIAVPLSIALGALSDRVLSANALLAGGRRYSVLFCQLLAAALVLVPFADNIWVILGLFAASLTGIAAAISLNVALVTDLFHQPRDVGKAIAMVILSGNLFGLLAPIITGYVIAGLGSYDWAFGIAGILLLIGATTVGILARRPILLPGPRPAAPLPATG